MRKVLAKIKAPYSINKLNNNDIIAGSEADGELLLLRSSGENFEYNISVIAKKPGGFMSILPFNQGENPIIVAIGDFKPVFKGENAGIFVYYPDGDISKEWKIKKIINLPFVHRIELVQSGGKKYLVSATICGGKDFQDDWEKPGKIYVSYIPSDNIISEKITAKPIPGLLLRKNHGLFRTHLEDYQKEGFLASAMEGVFFIIPPQDDNHQWTWERIINKEISDISAFDIDNCGRKEIITLEPFHGNVLSVYKKVKNKWMRIVIDDTLDFGHVVWAGMINGKPKIIAGSRKGEMELSIYTLEGSTSLKFSKRHIGRNIGAAQLTVSEINGSSVVFCTSTKNNEITICSIEDR